MLQLKPHRPPDPKPRIPPALRWLAHRANCEICQTPYNQFVFGREPRPHQRKRVRISKEHADHIFPRRWLRQYGLEPHVLLNLVSLCDSCHGVKKAAENRLFLGDAISYVYHLRTLHYPMQRVKIAAQLYGLWEIVRLLERD